MISIALTGTELLILAASTFAGFGIGFIIGSRNKIEDDKPVEPETNLETDWDTALAKAQEIKYDTGIDFGVPYCGPIVEYDRKFEPEPVKLVVPYKEVQTYEEHNVFEDNDTEIIEEQVITEQDPKPVDIIVVPPALVPEEIASIPCSRDTRGEYQAITESEYRYEEPYNEKLDGVWFPDMLILAESTEPFGQIDDRELVRRCNTEHRNGFGGDMYFRSKHGIDYHIRIAPQSWDEWWLEHYRPDLIEELNAHELGDVR